MNLQSVPASVLDPTSTSGTLRFDADAHAYFWLPDYGDRRERRLISVTQVLTAVGLIDNTWYTTFARDRGTYVHRMLELYERGVLDEAAVPEDYLGYLEGYRGWVAEAQAVRTRVEIRLPDPTEGYAGTIDWLGRLGQAPALVDFKTGAPCPWHQLQLAGYHQLVARTLTGTATKPHNVRRFGLYLTADGRYQQIPYTDRKDFARWMDALNLARWKDSHGYRDYDRPATVA